MNEKIQQFLDNYTCEFEHGQWRGNFTKTRTLHKTRDSLTQQDWIDITDLAMYGYWDLPNNLQSSLNSKFNRLVEFCIEQGYGETISAELIPHLMAEYEFTPKYAQVQQLVWGVLTSCIEVIHHNQQLDDDHNENYVNDWLEIVE